MPTLTRRRAKIAISSCLIVGLIYFLDFNSLGSAAKEIDFYYLVLAFFMVIGNRILMPIKWNLLLKARGIQLSSWQAIRIYTIASFLGLVLPPTLGADSIRGFYLKKAGIDLSDAVASIVIERVLGLVVLLIFAVVGFALLFGLLRDGQFQAFGIASFLVALSVAMLVVLYLSFTQHFQRYVTHFSARLQSTRLNKLARGVDSFVKAYQEYRHKKRVLIVFCGLTALELTLVIIRSYIIALSLGITLSVTTYFAFLPLVTLLNRMPISFDGFGINEALFIYFLGLFGVIAEKGFLIGLINHILFIFGVMPGGIFYALSDRAGEKSVPTTQR